MKHQSVLGLCKADFSCSTDFNDSNNRIPILDRQDEWINEQDISESTVPLTLAY